MPLPPKSKNKDLVYKFGLFHSGLQPFHNCKCDKSPEWDIRLDTISLGMSNYEMEWQWMKTNKYWLELQGAKRPIDSSSCKHKRRKEKFRVEMRTHKTWSEFFSGVLRHLSCVDALIQDCPDSSFVFGKVCWSTFSILFVMSSR